MFVIFSIVYIFPIIGKGERGIYLIRLKIKKVIRTDVTKDKTLEEHRRIHATNFKAIGYAFYFSLLSTFHIGWRDLNVGNWIVRIQPNDYIMKADGWVKSVSGIQSLLSIYLLALWVLTQFGRPFD